LYGYKGSTPTPEMFTKAGRVRVGTGVGRFWGDLEETWRKLGGNLEELDELGEKWGF
jgi:hypothetical protein